MFHHLNPSTIGCDAVEFTCDELVHVQQSTCTNEEITVEEAPLVLAIKNGNIRELRYLVEEAKANVNQTSNIWDEDSFYPINGSALHAAVFAGQFHIVNYLLDFCKVNIDAKTAFDGDPDGGSTALHLAVSHLSGNVQKEIVTSLLARGADWTIVNDDGKQCWEMTSNMELTKLFIEFNVGLDSSQNVKSLNIAHKWARRLEEGSAEVIALAIDKGINIYATDNEGSTPLMIAAIGDGDGQPNVKVVEALLNQIVQPISRFERIIAFELMGATLISSGNFDGLQHMKMAMELRTNDELPIPKPPLTDDIKMAFNVTSEVQTMHELETIAHSLGLLQVQAHLIRLRVLGLSHSETWHSLATHAFKIWFRKPQTFLNYLHLLLTGFDPTDEHHLWFEIFDYYKRLISLSLFALTLSISQSLPYAEVNTFNNVMPILRKLVSLLCNADNFSSSTIDFILGTIVNLTHVLLDGKPLTAQESFDLKCCLSQAVGLRKRNTEGLDLFLIACSKSVFSLLSITQSVIRNYEIDDGIYFRRYGSVKTISMLIEAGGDIDSVSSKGDTGFHVLAKHISNFKCNQWMPLLERLYEVGVHLDQTNFEGKTMIDILRDRGIRLNRSIFPAYLFQPTRLKCLSARLVPHHQTPFLKHLFGIPEYVMRHSRKRKRT